MLQCGPVGFGHKNLCDLATTDSGLCKRVFPALCKKVWFTDVLKNGSNLKLFWCTTVTLFCCLTVSQVLLNQLRAVFDQIIELQNAQDAMYRAALEELQLRLQFEERKKQRELEVQ